MSFNLRDWCPLHRQAVAALAAELADLRTFVRANVLDADAASRLEAKIGKTDQKFEAVEASGESLILAFEADAGSGTGCGSGSGSGGGDGTGSIHDDSTGSSEGSTGPATTIARQTEVVGPGDVGTSGAEIMAGGLPGTPPDTVQGSAPAGTGEGSQGAAACPSESSATEATSAPSPGGR